MKSTLSAHGILVRGNFALFWGGCFSNWYKSPFELDGIKFSCVEQYMMFSKALMFNDAKSLELIMNTNDPKKQKAYGRAVTGYIDAKWNKAKYPIVVKGVVAKFDQNPVLQQVLYDSNPLIIVESSPQDVQWGTGLGSSDEYAINPAMWEGKNLLGMALMDARATLFESIDD